MRDRHGCVPFVCCDLRTTAISYPCLLRTPSAALYTAARLGVADELHQGGPLPAAKLASRLAVKEDALARVLRCLAAHGVFREVRGCSPNQKRWQLPTV